MNMYKNIQKVFGKSVVSRATIFQLQTIHKQQGVCQKIRREKKESRQEQKSLKTSNRWNRLWKMIAKSAVGW